MRRFPAHLTSKVWTYPSDRTLRRQSETLRAHAGAIENHQSLHGWESGKRLFQKLGTQGCGYQPLISFAPMHFRVSAVSLWMMSAKRKPFTAPYLLALTKNGDSRPSRSSGDRGRRSGAKSAQSAAYALLPITIPDSNPLMCGRPISRIAVASIKAC